MTHKKRNTQRKLNEVISRAKINTVDFAVPCMLTNELSGTKS